MDSSENSVRRLAEKIAQVMLDVQEGKHPQVETFRFAVESLLSEAMEEARRGPPRAADCLMFVADHRKELEEARSAAYREVFEIAQKYCRNGADYESLCKEIADKHRKAGGGSERGQHLRRNKK